MNTLTHLFDWLLAASLRASLLTLAALLIQAALHRHLGARMRYALWLPVLIVLLMPVLPQSRWSIQQVFQTPLPPAQIIPAPMAPAMEPAPVVFEAVAPMPEPINWQRVFLMTWISVSAGMLLFGGISFMLTLRRFKQARHPASDELLATLAQIAGEMHLRYVPRVLIASSVSCPAVTGLLRPTLLLPAQFDREFTPSEARLVLKHELMHLKRGDLPLNALMCLLMALHWFNPLLWIAFFKIRADRESACDAQVLHDAPHDHRIAYGHALLKVETAFCPRGFSLGFVGIFQRGAALRSRIQFIAIDRAPHPSMKGMITLCIVLMTFFGITRAQQPKPDENAPLIAIEIKIVKFEKAADWNFGGRLPDKEANAFLPAVLLSPEELAVQLREIMRNESTNTISYPRMVTVSGHEVMVKAVVNQHYKGKDGKVEELPIGLVCKLTPAVNGERVKLDIDISNSALIDPATGAAISEVKGDHPTVRSLTYKASHEARDGQSWVIAGWDDDKPQIKRPVLYIITPHVIDPKKGGLPADLKLTTGTENTNERKIASNTDFIKTKLNEIIIPQVQFQDATVEEAIEYLRVKTRALSPDPAAPGVSIIYRASDPPSTATISMDLKDVPLGEALRYVAELANLKMSIRPYAVLIVPADAPESVKSAPSSSADSNNDNLRELVITAKETSIDPTTEIQTAKGDARCQVSGVSIQAQELSWNRKAHQLTIRGPFTIIQEDAGKKHSGTADSVAILDLTTGKLSTTGPHVTGIISPLESKIIFPRIEFRDSTITECIDFIRIQARELDPDKKGVTIVVMPGGDASARITLSLKNIPLAELLLYCAQLANHELSYSYDARSYYLKPAAKAPTSTAEAKAAELRKAPAQQYDFSKALFGDVLHFLATDASINFFALPDDNPINQKRVTFSIRSSPFAVLESLCRVNGAVLVFDQDRWFIRAADEPKQFGKVLVLPQTQAGIETIADDPKQIGQAYVLPQTRASVETILKDINSILGGGETKPVADKPQPSVQFKKEQNSVYVKATRLQHTWVSAYFQGMNTSAQTGKTK